MQATYMSRSFSSLNTIYGFGRNSSYHTRAHHVELLCFSKDKSLELQYHLEQDKQQLIPSYIISINYLDLNQAYATHENQVQSKFLYQIKSIQYSEEFRTENQALERNYNRATIHHFDYKRLSSESPFYFIQLLKIKLKANFSTHSFCFVFIFLYHTLLIYI